MHIQSADYRNLDGGERRSHSRMRQYVTLFGLCCLATCLLGIGFAFYLYVKDHGTDEKPAVLDTGPTSVVTSLGTIFGLKKYRTHEYLGIPYAEPPVGKLRWKAPQPYTHKYPEQGLAAQSFKPSCYQTIDLSTQPTGIAEDCLYLNVFTPADKKELAPVMFFIHGGGGLVGGAAQSVPTLYNGTNLIYSPYLDYYPRSVARDTLGIRNVVVVTINYRLGPFAQLYLNQLVDEDTIMNTAGMYNHLDIQMALKWVRTNIKLFGGDPSKVTVFGESAGANLALTQTILKGSEGLIHRAISQSGTWGLPMSDSSLTDGIAAGKRFIAASKCDTPPLSDAETLRCLRALPAARVLEVADAAGTEFNSIRGVIDGKLLTDFPSYMINTTQSIVNKVPIIWGHNRDDSFVPLCPYVPDWMNITEGLYNDRAKLRFQELGVTGSWVDRIIARFPFSSCVAPGDQPLTRARCCAQLENMTRDYVWVCNGRRMFTSYHTSTSLPVYNYLFAQVPICPRPPQHGLVDHTEELAYVFGTRSSYLAHGMETDCGWPDNEKDFSFMMSDRWSMFARTGDPSLSTPAEWQSYDVKDAERYMTLKLGQTTSNMVDAATRDRCDTFWDPFSRDLINSQRT